MKKLIKLILPFFLIVQSCKDQEYNSSFPSALIKSAKLYVVDKEEIDPFVRNGKLPKLILDSIKLRSTEWKEIIVISDQKLSDDIIAIDCFQPDFIVVFYGRVDRYLSHVAVSFTCNQIKYEDNSGINILTKPQRKRIEEWYRDVYSPKE